MAQKQPPYVGGVGTIGVGGTTFTVTGALDDTNCIEGDHVRDPATGYESRVLERLTVQTFRVPPWRGAALAGAAYELYPDSNLRGGYQAAVTTQLLARLSAKGLVWNLPAEFASPTAAKWGADENQYVWSPSLKKWWIMQSGVWTVTGAPYGMMPSNNLSDLTDPNQALINLGANDIGRWMFTAPDVESSPNGVLTLLGFSTLGRTLRAVASAAAARTALALGSIATRNLSDTFWFTDTTESTAPSNGALATSGGWGIAKSVFAGGLISTERFFRSSANSRSYPQVQLQSQSGFAIANNANDVVAPQNFYGLMIIADGNTGDTALVLCAYQTAKLLGDVGSHWANTDTVGKLSVTYAAGYGYLINNRSGLSSTFSVGLIQLK